MHLHHFSKRKTASVFQEWKSLAGFYALLFFFRPAKAFSSSGSLNQ